MNHCNCHKYTFQTSEAGLTCACSSHSECTLAREDSWLDFSSASVACGEQWSGGGVRGEGWRDGGVEW